MTAVATQQLATVSDLDTGPATSSLVQSLAMYTSGQKDVYLRRASGDVLSAYAKRFARTAGSSFTLAKWGDLTIDLVVTIARWKMISDRGYNAANAADKAIRDRFDDAQKVLLEIRDITNAGARIDPDVVGSPDADDEGPLAASEGGALDQSDAWATSRGRCGLMGLY